MQLSSVPSIIAAALALASIGHTSPVDGPKKGLESVDVNQLNEGLGLPHVTAPKANQLRAERQDKGPEVEWSENLWASGRRAVEVNQARTEGKGDEVEVVQDGAERQDKGPELKWSENLWASGRRAVEVNQARTEGKGDEVEVVQDGAERQDKGPEVEWSENLWASGRRAVEVNQARAERNDNEPEGN